MYSPYRKNSYRLRSDNYGLYSNKIDSYNAYGDNSRIDSYGAYSSYGGGCCDPVVDPLTYAALLGFLALATYFFQVLIEMSMLAKKRRKRRSINEPDNVFYDVFDEGKKIQFINEIESC